MTTPLTKEVRYVQNPALGAVLLWRFSVGFTESHTTSDSPVLPLSFLVLPILMHHETFDFLRSTQKQTGLQLCENVLSEFDSPATKLLFARLLLYGSHEKIARAGTLLLEILEEAKTKPEEAEISVVLAANGILQAGSK